MNPIQELIANFQALAAFVPELIQPFVVLLAATIPFLEGEVASMIGILAGVNPIIAGLFAAAGNFLSVLLVVSLTSRARSAVVTHRAGSVSAISEVIASKPQSKGRQRLTRWLIRFGVPGASILAPLVIPTQFTSTILVAGGTPRRWVLLWQAVAIVIWTTVTVVGAWLAVTLVTGA